jgi:S1-C subfamily serine protease
MVDSPNFVDTTAGPRGSVGNFGDLAQQILDGQIATRKKQSQGDSSNRWWQGSGDQTSVPSTPQWQLPQDQEQVPSIPRWRSNPLVPPVWAPPPVWRQEPTPSMPERGNQNAPIELQRIPTLRVNFPADQNDSSLYSKNSTESKLYDANRDSVVQIYGHARGKAPNFNYSGSGFFVSNHGDIATAYHVISDVDSIQVTTSDGVEHPARVVSTRPTADVAIIHIDTNSSTKPAALADTSNFLRRGEPISTIGHPEGWQQEYLSPGKFTSTDTARDITGGHELDRQNPNHILLTTSQNIQSGDSGAPAFNNEGKVIGIVSRGDHGSHGYMVSVNDLWPLMDKVSAPRQANAYKQSDIPFKLHLGADQYIYSTASALTLSSMLSRTPILQSMGFAARGFSGTLAGYELWSEDLPFLANAFEHGSTREKVSAVAEAGADALMVSGAILTVMPKFRAAAPAVSLAGSLLKAGNGIAAFRSYS